MSGWAILHLVFLRPGGPPFGYAYAYCNIAYSRFARIHSESPLHTIACRTMADEERQGFASHSRGCSATHGRRRCLSLGMRARSALRVHCEAKKRTCDREPHAQAWNFSNVAATAVCGHAAAGCDDVACAALDVPQ